MPPCIVEMWWDDLPESDLSQSEEKRVVRFTKWVIDKQPQQKYLIKKIIAKDSKGTLLLLPPEKTLLSKPYAGGYRRRLFSGIPVISDGYCKDNPELADTWKAAFENLKSKPLGQFQVNLIVKPSLDMEMIKEALGKTPDLRTRYLSMNWYGFEINNNNFYILDGTLPVLDEIRDNYNKAQCLVQWLEENPVMIGKHKNKRIGYMPYGSGHLSETIISNRMTWVSQLEDTNWIPWNDHLCYKPRDILISNDPSRPEAPHANFSVELVKVLNDLHIEFGKNIPKTPSLIRLRSESQTAGAGQIQALLEEVIAEVDGIEDQRLILYEFLENSSFIPLPAETSTPDRSLRISFRRIVANSGTGKSRRSDLMGWVVTKDNYGLDSDETSLIERIEKYLGKRIPTTTTFGQTVEFLEWVWKKEPPAEQIRSALRSAYEYIEEESREKGNIELWASVAQNAKVFTSKKQWKPATSVYYDDLERPGLLKLNLDIEFATKGHLGYDRTTAEKVADLLKIRRLSERLKITSTYGDEIPFSLEWQSHFDQLSKTLQKYLQTAEVDDDESPEDGLRQLQIKMVKDIKIEVHDEGKKITERSDQCDYNTEGGEIVIKGEIEDFAPGLCDVLISIWGLSRRGELVSKIAFLISAIGDRKRFAAGLKKLREFCFLDEIEEGVTKVLTQKGGDDSCEVGTESSKGSTPEKLFPKKEGPAGEEATVAITNRLEGPEAEIFARPQGRGGGANGASKVDLDGKGKGNQGEEETRENEVPGGGEIGDSDGHKTEQKKLPPGQYRQQRRINRIVTYVFPDEEDEEEKIKVINPEKYREIILVGETAEQIVMRTEHDAGRRPIRMPPGNPGYDIESYDKSGEDIRYIEVKGINGEWSVAGVGISARQYREAQTRGDNYWLYVVENVFFETPTIHRFQNPVKNIGNYRFDSNWRKLGNSENGESNDPKTLGMMVYVDGKQATIVEITSRGELGDYYRVRYEDGGEELVVNPSRLQFGDDL
jgi:hypothetical protein